MSKLMSLAWSANMFSMVGQVWPYRSTVRLPSARMTKSIST